jgi:hypothetical protein
MSAQEEITHYRSQVALIVRKFAQAKQAELKILIFLLENVYGAFANNRIIA